jgi:hypothetical protein
MTRRLAIAALASTLAACATTDDPAKGGFISGIANLSDGTYERRQQALKTSLEDEQDVNAQKTREAERVNAQRDAVSAERTAAESRYAALQSELNGLKTKLAAARKRNAALKKETAALEGQIADLETKARMVQNDTFTPDPERQKRLEALRAEKEALEREVDMAIRR